MDEERVWEVVAAALAAATALLVAGVVLQAFAFGPSGSTRQRLEIAAQGANPLLALLALIPVAIVFRLNVRAESQTQLRRWIVWVAMAAALAVTIGAVYSIWDVLTVPIGRTGNLPLGSSQWSGRLAVVLTRLAVLSIAVVALLLGGRPQLLRSRPSGTRMPLRTKDWPDPWEDEAATGAGE